MLDQLKIFGKTFSFLAESSALDNDITTDTDALNVLGVQHSKSTGSLDISSKVRGSPVKFTATARNSEGETYNAVSIDI